MQQIKARSVEDEKRRVERAEKRKQRAEETKTPPGEILITYRQTEKKVGVERTTIWRMVRRGDFPAPVKTIGAQVRFKLSAVEKWIADRAVVVA